jgi:hypothetical protein
LYLTDWFPATLPLDHPGLVGLASPRPVPVGAGLAAGVVAVRVADLPAAASGSSGVLVPTGGGPVRDGELVAWCAVVTVAPAVVDGDGVPQAEGWLPDHVRLGVLETHLGDGVVERVVAENGRQPQRRQRLMSLALVARLVLAMTLLPNASYVEAMAQLVGSLPRLPWSRPWWVPSSRVVTAWRRRLGPHAMRELFARVAGPVVAAATGAGELWCGLRVAALDGTQIRAPDSEANRAAFGSSGTSDDTAPFPLVRMLLATARAGRAILAACFDASHVGEQTLAARLVAEHPDLFTNAYVYLLDRNFPGYQLIDAIHRGGQGAHLVMRIKDGIKLRNDGWLPDGSYRSYLTSPDRKDRLPVRVVEYDVTLPEDGVSELFCLATTLLDHKAYPAARIAGLYPKRWSASETTIGENKSTITDAGPSRGPILRSEEPDLVRQEMWAWLTATQLVRKAAYAATQTTTGVSTDEISFTTMRREATRSMTQSLVTATTTPEALAAAADHAARGALSNLVVTNRERRSPRRQKHSPRFPHTTTTKTTTKGRLRVNLSRPPAPADTS